MNTKIHPMKMAFPYINPPGLPDGDWRREGVVSKTTYDAILAGERTATTRFPKWYTRNPYQLEAIKALAPGDIVTFTCPKRPDLKVEVIPCDLAQRQRAIALLHSNVTKLNPNEVFVFGSNTQGRHGKGAAQYALDHFGAVYGQSRGHQGNSYAIETKSLTHGRLKLETIAHQIEELYCYARSRPDLTFVVTPIGTGLAGYCATDIAPLFARWEKPDNVSLAGVFQYPEWELLGGCAYELRLSLFQKNPNWLERWSELEGWSCAAGLHFFADEPTQTGYQFQFKPLNHD